MRVKKKNQYLALYLLNKCSTGFQLALIVLIEIK